MGIDYKYGKVTLEHGTIGEDEPVVVFRANDMLLPKLLDYYHMFCMQEGSPKRHLSIIIRTRDIVAAWQQKNGSKIPDSASSLEWMD